MARVTKVVIGGREIETTATSGEVEVHIQDGPVDRILTFGEDAREQVLKGGDEVEDSNLSYGDLFGNSPDSYEDEDDEEECCDCGLPLSCCDCDDFEDEDEDDEVLIDDDMPF